MITIEKAINALGNYKYIIRGDCNTEEDFNTKIEWIANVDEQGNQTIGSKPSDLTWDKVNTKWQELKTAYTNNAYARKRATEYPSIQDFMEAYTEKEIGGDSTKWDAYKIAYNKVRTDNPKE